MKETKLEKKLKRELDLKGINIIISSIEDFNSINSSILNHYSKKKKKLGVYITLNKGYKKTTEILKKQKVDISNLYFIDGITETQGEEVKADNCTFVSSPHDLAELSLAITTAINTKKFDFLFLESINTLLIYNDRETTKKFVSYISLKLKKANVTGIIFLIKEKSADKLIPSITEFSDKLIFI